jgi:hypothetical protein
MIFCELKKKGKRKFMVVGFDRSRELPIVALKCRACGLRVG